MVGLLPLEQCILVRIQVPQQNMRRITDWWILISIYGALFVNIWQLADSVTVCDAPGCDLTWSGIILLPLLPGLIVAPFWALSRLRVEKSLEALAHLLVAFVMLAVTLWRMLG